MKDEEKRHELKKKEMLKKGSSAAGINAIINSPTDHVRARHSTKDWGNTGTNISYEGNTAPAAGGSVGTGQASGKNATGARISTDSEYDNARVEEDRKDKKKEDK